MATYNLPNGPQGNLAAGDIINCRSGAQSITLPPGSYKLECWGAQGGSYSTTYGGKGGYSFGEITLSSNTTVYLYAGGQGTGGRGATALPGGFNGGGNGYGYGSNYTNVFYGSGGGASDIRIGTDSLYARVIVAGGGGGCGSYSGSYRYGGGYGGGETGATGLSDGSQYNPAGTGGLQTTPGTSYYDSLNNPNPGSTNRTLAAFGIGGAVASGKTSRTAGGGGGWYGGGYSTYAGAGGGSGYVYTSSTASNYPSGCLLNSSYYLADAGTQGGNTSFKSPTNTTETGHANNGHVRITVISIIEKYPIYVKVSGAYNQVKDIYVKANGIWNEAQLYIKNDGTWTKILRDTQYDAKVEYLTFVARQSGTFSFSEAGLSYSLDNGATWTALAAGESTPTVAAGKTVMWKNNTTLTPASSTGIGTFSSTGNFDAEGNIMSLYYGDNFSEQTDLSGKTYAFYKLFYSCNKLYNAENLILPATTLSNRCYSYMFYNCTGLTTPPELPATTLATGCYRYMFYGCTGLTIAPELPATTLTSNCYQSMFQGCTGLTTAPELPATTLATSCYAGMFQGCTGLTTAPELPATTLKTTCYNSMFYNCTNLCQVKAAFITTPGSSYTSSWLYNVASTGTFYKNSGASWTTTGVSAVPTGWTIIRNIGADNLIFGADAEYDSYVWVGLSMLKGSNPINQGNNSYTPQWNNIPIYGVAAINNSNTSSYCRAGFSPNPNQSYDTSHSDAPARIWLSGANDNKLFYPGSPWSTYSQAGWASDIININSQTTYVYYNNDAAKISSYDETGPGLLYFYTYQTNFPINCFYVLISKDDLNRILGL